MVQQDVVDCVHRMYGHIVDIQGYWGVCPSCGKLVMRFRGRDWYPTGWGLEQCGHDTRAEPVDAVPTQP